MAMLFNAAGSANQVNQVYQLTDDKQDNLAKYQARQEALDAVRNGNVQHVPEELRGMLEQQDVKKVESPSFSAMLAALERKAAETANQFYAEQKSAEGTKSDQQAEMNRYTLGM